MMYVLKCRENDTQNEYKYSGEALRAVALQLGPVGMISFLSIYFSCSYKTYSFLFNANNIHSCLVQIDCFYWFKFVS